MPFRIGTSGYQYNHWKGIFYPEKLAQDGWLRFYSEHFDTVEINNTFYHLPTERSFDQWCEQADAGFIYALKFSRYGSHMKKLKDPEEPIERFLGLAARLKQHLGPILVQLPPKWHADPARLSNFLNSASPQYRWAVEFRDVSWLTAEIFSILRQHNAALCFHDMIPDHPHEQTADWIYWRFHGTAGHAGNYSDLQLNEAAHEIKTYLDRGLEVFVYFNNDVHGHAIANALALRRNVWALLKRA